MSELRVQIAETKDHKLKGDYPEIDTYEHVNTDELYAGDDKPFHVNLPIAEVGRVSVNGLDYDEELVTSIAEQLKGKDGIRGHISDEDAKTAFPPGAVYWIGDKRVGDVLWAKGYIPPGETREDIRRKKAIGGSLGTSIYGNAVKELKDKTRGVWKAKNFDLDQVDLAPAKRASLKHNSGFTITKEMEGDMPTDNVREINSAMDVPQTVREQIISQYELEGKASRVAELTSTISELTAQVSELATYRTIVTEIRQTLGSEADTVQTVKELFESTTKLAEMLGVPFTNISVRVEEMHEQVRELAANQFAAAIDGAIAELTPWSVKNADAQKKIDGFRKSFRRVAIAELGEKRDAESVKEMATKIWDEEFADLAKPLIAELVGGSAVVKPVVRQNAGREEVSEDKLVSEVKSKWGLS